MAQIDDPPFVKFAVAAFPWSCRVSAEAAARTLAPLADDGYRRSSLRALVLGSPIQIPKRIHFLGRNEARLRPGTDPWLAARCLCTRSTDGYERQASLRRILSASEPWVIPFVVLLAGEYVVEIAQDIFDALSILDRNAYTSFVRENRPVIRLLRSKASSYWNCYYRDIYPDRRFYPGLAFLHQLEHWAM
jgi:hypothetical protein